MFFVYSVLSYLAHLIIAPYFLCWPAARRKYLATLAERFSLALPTATLPGQPCIWVHAVSVGEVLAVSQLMDGLRRALPEYRIFISTITVAGNALAKKRFPDLEVVFFPLDWGWVIGRLLRRIRPSVFLSVESEFWPNFYRLAHATGCRLIIVNGRITAKACRNYCRARFLFKKTLSCVDLCLMQTEEYARRILQIGAPKERVLVSGNLKFDLELQESPAIRELLESIRAALIREPGDPILVAGSTMPGEEEQVLELFRQVQVRHPGCRMILAPRHPQRFDQVAQLLEEQGCKALRRSRLETRNADQPVTGSPQPGTTTDNQKITNAQSDILLLDSIGELAFVYQLATVAFVGGSLVPHGGHNILEPAYYGKATVVGPSMSNFQDIARCFVDGQGAMQASNLDELKEIVERLIDNPELRAQTGANAARIMAENRGALERTLAHVLKLAGSGPQNSERRLPEN